MLQMGRQLGFYRAKVLLQPLAHGIANRSAGLAIELFAVVGSAVHDGSRLVFGEVMLLNQVAGVEMVSRRGGIACPVAGKGLDAAGGSA